MVTNQHSNLDSKVEYSLFVADHYRLNKPNLELCLQTIHPPQ